MFGTSGTIVNVSADSTSVPFVVTTVTLPVTLPGVTGISIWVAEAFIAFEMSASQSPPNTIVWTRSRSVPVMIILGLSAVFTDNGEIVTIIGATNVRSALVVTGLFLVLSVIGPSVASAGIFTVKDVAVLPS